MKLELFLQTRRRCSGGRGQRLKCEIMNPAVSVSDANRLASKNGAYTFIKKLGRGAFGTVFLAKDKKTGLSVAIKVIHVRASLKDFLFRRKPEQVKEAQQEANLLLELRNERVVEFLGAYEFTGSFFKRGLAIVTEFCCKGSLEQCLTDLPLPPPLDSRLVWYDQLSAGLAYIHEKNIAHRDLKPANILVDSKDNLKIADVGLAKAIWDDQQKEVNCTYQQYMSSVAGTPAYMAPEVWNNLYDYKCDVFSIGLVFVMIAECPKPLLPLAVKGIPLGMLLSEVTSTRQKNPIDLLHPPVHRATADEKNLFNRLLQYNPHRRPDMVVVQQTVRIISRRRSIKWKVPWRLVTISVVIAAIASIWYGLYKYGFI